MPDIKLMITDFCAKLEEYHTEALTKKFGSEFVSQFSPAIHAEIGRKYARIVKRERNRDGVPSGGSVYCFIDLSNGDILKAAGWAAPAKGARGSILNSDFDIGYGKPCDLYGSGLYRRG